MKTVKISAVKARAERLNQPEMLERYREMAINDDTSVVIELTDVDHNYLNSLWRDSMRTRNNPNGTIVVISNPKSATPPEGYKRSKLNPSIFEPILEECKHLDVKVIVRNCCGGNKSIRNCLLNRTIVTLGDCKECQDAGKHITP